jgi:F0F1-type ATP synthase membrane subunit b/b'
MFQRSNLDEFIELWGENFTRSNLGLNEDQVKAFIGRLISEREILLERDKQFKALALQAEKITMDAEGVANEIRRKAEDIAHAQATIILNNARDQANELIEQKRVEAEALAQRGAELILSSAQSAAQKCISDAEEEAHTRAKSIIMRAIVEGNELIEQKRSEAKVVAREEVDVAKADILADAQRRLKEAGEEAESQAEAQAQAILFSSKISKDN